MTSREFIISILALIFIVSGIPYVSYSSKTLTRIRKSKDIDKHLVRKSILRIGLINFIGSLAISVVMVMIEFQDTHSYNAFLYLLCVPGYVIGTVGIFLYKVFLLK